jgi:hypothetical protein
MSFIIHGAAGNDAVVNSSGALSVAQSGTSNVTYSPSDPVIDSFEHMQSSLPHIEFEQSFSSAPNAALWEQTAYGAGTLTNPVNSGTTSLNTIANTPGTGYWIQSYAQVRYSPGIGSIFRMTFKLATDVAGLSQRVGMYSDQTATPGLPGGVGDGLYFEASGGVKSLVLRNYIGSVASEVRVAQTAWNLDKLDGTGASGVNINWSLPQHLVCKFQWLGVGVIRMGFNTSVGLVWAHEFVSVNSMSTPYSRTGTLPFRAEIFTTTGTVAASSLQLINCVCIQEKDGSTKRGWKYFSGNSGSTTKTVGTASALYPIAALRALLTDDFTKRTTIIPTKITINVVVVGTGTTSIQWALLGAPTPMSGATFAVSAGAGSTVGIDNAATATTAVTGNVLFSGCIPNVVGTYEIDLTNYDDNILRAGQNAAGTLTITGQNVLTLAAGTLTGTCTVAPQFACALSWKELV